MPNFENLAIKIKNEVNASDICIGNSMICSDIWHKYYEWHFSCGSQEPITFIAS